MKALVLFVASVFCSVIACASEPPVVSLVFSPEGSSLLIGSQRGLEVTDWPTTNPRRLLNTKIDEPVHCIAVAPSGHQIAVAGGTASEWGKLWICSWPGGEVVAEKIVHDDTIMDVAWSPDGKWIATASLDSMTHIYEMGSMRLLHRFEGHSKGLMAVDFVQNNRLVTASRDATIRLWRIDGQSLIQTLRHHTDTIGSLSVMPPSTDAAQPMAVSISQDRSVRFWQPLIGRLVRFARLSDETPLDVQWLGQEHVVVAGSKGSALIVDASDASIKRLPSINDRLLSVAVHPGSNWLALGGFSGKIYKLEIP